MRYFHHPESSCIFMVDEEEEDPRESGTADGELCEEIWEEQYNKLAEEYKTFTSDGFCCNCGEHATDQLVRHRKSPDQCEFL